MNQLPKQLAEALQEYCERTKEKPADVLADAVALFLDERESDPE